LGSPQNATHWILREAITQKTSTFLENIVMIYFYIKLVLVDLLGNKSNPIACFSPKTLILFFSYSQNIHHSPDFFLL